MRVIDHFRPVAAAEGAIAGRCVSFRILLPRHGLGKELPAVIAVFFQGGVAVVELGLAAAVAVVPFIGIKIRPGIQDPVAFFAPGDDLDAVEPAVHSPAVDVLIGGPVAAFAGGGRFQLSQPQLEFFFRHVLSHDLAEVVHGVGRELFGPQLGKTSTGQGQEQRQAQGDQAFHDGVILSFPVFGFE